MKKPTQAELEAVLQSDLATSLLGRGGVTPREIADQLKTSIASMGFQPHNCPYCEYDRRFPGFESGGWIQQDNNGPIVSCLVCNDDGTHPRS